MHNHISQQLLSRCEISCKRCSELRSVVIMMSKPISPAGPSHPPNLSPILSSNEAPPIIPLPTLLNWPKQPLPPQVILDRFLKAAPHSAQQAITLTTSWFNNLLETIGGHKGPLVDLMANRLGLGTGRTTELGRRIMAAVVFSPAFAPGLQALSDLQPDAAQVWTDNLPKLSQAFLQYLDVRVPRAHIFLPLWEVTSVFGSIADMAAATGRRTRPGLFPGPCSCRRCSFHACSRSCCCRGLPPSSVIDPWSR